MNLRWVKTNWLIKKIFSNYIWDLPNDENKIYLTFDDGPTPNSTEWVLEQLELYKAKATFFCIGENIKNYPVIFEKIVSKGHTIGNHTQKHPNGWKTKDKVYIDNVELCKSVLEEHIKKLCKSITSDSQSNNLFRPPYGKIKPSQSTKLRKKGYKIIMWNIVSYDFDPFISKEECLQNVLLNIQSGSIIVFHDSVKAFSNLEFVLPKVLEYCAKKGFICESIRN
jgi:peptidoglycan-N-acetylglucosamine deacetylase